MTPEVLVIGGGVAGSTAARELAQAGRTVVLVEKSQAQAHKVCGEFLSGETAGYLDRAGIAPLQLGAIPVDRVRLLRGARVVGEAALPFPALSLGRDVLDEALLASALKAGVALRRGERVERLEQEGAGWVATLSDGGRLCARSVFLATGKHDLLGHARPPGVQNSLVAFKMYFALAPEAARALGSAVELALYPGGYAGLQPVGDGKANLVPLVEREVLRRLGGQWPALLEYMLRSAPVLADRLRGAQPLWARPLALSSIPYGLLMRSAPTALWRIGDQAVVIPSFAGEGIALAFHTAHTAAAAYLRGESPAAHARALAAQLGGQLRRATAVSRALVGAPSAAAGAVQLWPGLLPLVARQTRIATLFAACETRP